MFNSKHISIRAFTLAGACLGALHLGLVTLFANLGYGREIIDLLSTLFIGIEPTLPGFFLAVVWGFLVGGFYGFILSWLYEQIV